MGVEGGEKNEVGGGMGIYTPERASGWWGGALPSDGGPGACGELGIFAARSTA